MSLSERFWALLTVSLFVATCTCAVVGHRVLALLLATALALDVVAVCIRQLRRENSLLYSITGVLLAVGSAVFGIGTLLLLTNTVLTTYFLCTGTLLWLSTVAVLLIGEVALELRRLVERVRVRMPS